MMTPLAVQPQKNLATKRPLLPNPKTYYLHPQRKTLRVVPREMPSRMTPAQELQLVWWLTVAGWQQLGQQLLSKLQRFSGKLEARSLSEKE